MILFYLFSFWINAAPLSDLQTDNLCRAQDLAADPLHKNSLISNSPWKDLISENSLFDPLKMSQTLSLSHLVRDGLTSEHIVNMLADGFKKIRLNEMEAIERGEIKPIVEGRSYTHQELKRRKKTLDDFYKKYVEPVLQNTYRYYLSVHTRREELRKNAGAPQDIQKAVSLVNDQVDFLNKNLKRISPSLVEKFGEIHTATAENLTLSYRDGFVVKIQFGDVTFYPRMIANQILGEDDYFLRGMNEWVKYTKAQAHSGSASAAQAAELALQHFEGAQKVHKIMSSVSESDLVQLMGLFFELNKKNIPQCDRVIAKLNERLKKKLGDNKTSLRLGPADRLEVESMAKDLVFYQDIFKVFAEAASLANPPLSKR